MKKSVLIALLGLSSTAEAESMETEIDNIVNLEDYVELSHDLSSDDEEEMNEFDRQVEAEEADSHERAHQDLESLAEQFTQPTGGSTTPSYDPKATHQTGASLTQPTGGSTTPSYDPKATHQSGSVAQADKAGKKPKKASDSLDEDCACKPKLPTKKEKVKIKAVNEKNIKAAKAATAKATVDRKKA